MKFPQKLWTLVNECNSGAISWGADGKTVVVDYFKFQKEFLGENTAFFKTKNIISFIRQLNLYGFRKYSRYMEVHEFMNPYFVRGRPDLLKNMRRKLGYTSNVELPIKKMKKETAEVLEGKENYISNDVKESPKRASVAGPSSTASYSFPSLQDLNLLPSGWWGNAYNPLNLLPPTHAVHPMQNEDYNSLYRKEALGGVPGTTDENLYWRNLEAYRNCFFLPIPAQYGMYPGFYSGSMSMPHLMPQQEEITKTTKE